MITLDGDELCWDGRPIRGPLPPHIRMVVDEWLNKVDTMMEQADGPVVSAHDVWEVALDDEGGIHQLTNDFALRLELPDDWEEIEVVRKLSD